MRAVGIITGLALEARLLRREIAALPETERPRLGVAAGRAERARELGLAMARQGAGGLVSFGLAGGLDPALGTGDIVVPAAVRDAADHRYEVDAGWRARLIDALAELPGGAIETLAGSESPVTTTADKAALRQRSGAAAVDMESHGVARAAQEAGLPFLVLRAVGDPAGRAIPRSALAGMGPDGESRVGAVVGALMLRPWELPALLALARDTGRATSALRRAAALGGAVLFRR